MSGPEAAWGQVLGRFSPSFLSAVPLHLSSRTDFQLARGTQRPRRPAPGRGRPRDGSNYLRMCDGESGTITHTQASFYQPQSSSITRADGRINNRGVH